MIKIKKTLLSFALALMLTAFTPLTYSSPKPININTANVQQLVQLKGIGMQKAKAIVEYRKKNGKFKSVEDLQNVSGIGSATIKKNQKSLKVK